MVVWHPNPTRPLDHNHLNKTYPFHKLYDDEKEKIGRILSWNLQPTSKFYGKAATDGLPMASSTPYVVEFGPIRFPTEAS